MMGIPLKWYYRTAAVVIRKVKRLQQVLVWRSGRSAQLGALISSERGVRPSCSQAVVQSGLDAFSSLTGRTILISTTRAPELPTNRPFIPIKQAAAFSPSSRHETDSGRTDEDEQDMPDGICHLFGIFYSGHLLFPKYVPTR